MQAGERIHLLDEIRGLAVLGMLLINIAAFGVPSIAVLDPGLVGTFDAIDRAFFNLMLLCGEGSFRAIFCVLFGIGALIQYERVAEKTNPENAVVLHRRRMRWLILFGLLDAYLFLWYGDILFLYGLVGLFLLSFRNLATSRLLLIALLLLSLLAVQNLYFGEFLSAPKNQLINPLDGEVATSEAVRAQMISEARAEVEAIRGGYLSAWPSRGLLAAYVQLANLWRGLWEVLALMLIGMAVYKRDAHQAKFSAARYAVFSITCLCIGLFVNSWEIGKSASTGLPALVQLLWTYDLGRIALAFSYAGFFMLLYKLDLAKGLRALLAATGRMALTNYVLQSLICGFIFVGLGLFAQLRFHQLYFVVLLIWAFQLWASRLWFDRYYAGPLEWLWRSLVYRQRQPFLRR